MSPRVFNMYMYGVVKRVRRVKMIGQGGVEGRLVRVWMSDRIGMVW